MPEPIRIRQLVKGLGPGGAERLVVTQVLGADPSRHRHDVRYLLAHKDHLVSELTAAGIDVDCLDARRELDPGWVARLRRGLLDDPVDVVHIHSPVVAAVVRPLVRTLPVAERPAVVTTEHNRWPRHRRATRWANRLTIGLDDATLAVSDDVRATMRGRADIRTVVHGVDLAAVRATADRAAVRAELGVDATEVLVVCVANLRREKALDQLVEAAAIASSTAPSLRYALVGQGPLEGEIRRAVAHHGLTDRFAVLGYRDDAARVLSGADVFTLSSRHEGLPVALMEALALGLPIVATAAGGVPEAVGTAGIVVAVDDAAALAAAHVALATDEQRRSVMAAAAEVEAERFSAQRAVAEIEAIYDAVARPVADRASNQS